MSSGRFDKICKMGEGEFLQAHIRFEKDLQTGGRGKFLQAHISKCPVADLRKIYNPGGGNFCMQVSVNVQW